MSSFNTFMLQDVPPVCRRDLSGTRPISETIPGPTQALCLREQPHQSSPHPSSPQPASLLVLVAAFLMPPA